MPGGGRASPGPQVGGEAAIPGSECCGRVFMERPHLTQHGTCFTSRPSFPVHVAGLSVVTQHDSIEFDPVVGSPDIVGAQGPFTAWPEGVLSPQGVSFAVADSSLSPGAALAAHGVSVQPDTHAFIGLGCPALPPPGLFPTLVDERELAWGLIGRQACLDPGDAVEPHLNMGQQEWGYSRDNCRLGKQELAAASLLRCSFLLTGTAPPRCSPSNSSLYSSSLLGGGGGGPSLKMGPALMEQFQEECPADCQLMR